MSTAPGCMHTVVAENVAVVAAAAAAATVVDATAVVATVAVATVAVATVVDAIAAVAIVVVAVAAVAIVAAVTAVAESFRNFVRHPALFPGVPAWVEFPNRHRISVHVPPGSFLP